MNGLFVNGSTIEKSLQAFSWMLIHSLWQGLLLAIITGMVMQFTKKARAITRYALIAGLLFTFLVVCCGTFIYEWNRGNTTDHSLYATTRFSGISVLKNFAIEQWPAALAQYCSDNATLIVSIWFAFFTFRCWKMRRALGYVRRVRTTQYQLPGQYWQHKMTALTRQLHIQKTVTLLESGITKIPVVIGHLKPVIYMPIGLLTNLPPEQIEAVLLHELAHIRRNDYLVNWLQHMTETILFFNPGFLWASSLLKQEREHCCDDVALAHTGNKKQFIQALISFKEYMIYGQTYAVAFPGKKNHLLKRVTRIIQNRNNPLSGVEKICLLGSLLVCFILLGTMPHNKELSLDHSSVKNMYASVMNEPRPADALMTAKGKKATLLKKQETLSRKPATKTPVEPQVIPVPADETTTAVVNPAPKEPEPASQYPLTESQRSLSDHEQTMKDIRQAARDRQQAERDREQADNDRKQAERDRQFAELNRRQADRDRLQAAKDREQADRDREQADKDRTQAAIHRIQADRDRANAEQARRQADKDREHAERTRAQQSEKQKLTII